jgi:hypothetical protein
LTYFPLMSAWVKSRHDVLKSPCPLYPQKRTLPCASWMSALCHYRTFHASKFRSLDYVVGDQQDITVDRQSQSSCSFHVDYQLELSWSFHRQLRRLRPSEWWTGSNGHREIEGVTPKQLPAPSSHVLPSDNVEGVPRLTPLYGAAPFLLPLRGKVPQRCFTQALTITFALSCGF